MKKIFLIIISIVVVFFGGIKVWNWYEPYHDAKEFWGIDVPIKARVLKNEKIYDFAGQGYSKLIFDVKDVSPEIEDMIKRKSFIRSKKPEIKYVTKYGPKVYNGLTSIKKINDDSFNEPLGLANSYYLDLADTSSMDFNIIIYNQKAKTLYFLHSKH